VVEVAVEGVESLTDPVTAGRPPARRGHGPYHDAGATAGGSMTVFPPVERAVPLSDRVADAMLAHIVRAGLRPGERLPSERELGEQFGVSRTVVREALRSLAAKGVLTVQSGAPATVARVDADRATEALRLYVVGLEVGSGGLDYAQIDDVRSVVECRVARLAAEAATDDDVARLERVHDEFRAGVHDVEAASALDVEFHRAVAVASHNPLFLLVLDSIEPVLLRVRRRTLGVPGRPERAIDAHGKVLDRIRHRDPAGAEAAMYEHLEESRRAWRALE
jgi:GntR family transcriptional repressor for pyruvate dehydrogenase complex